MSHDIVPEMRDYNTFIMRISKKDDKSGQWSEILSWKFTLCILLTLSLIIFREKTHNDKIQILTSSNQIKMEPRNWKPRDSIPHVMWFTYKYNLLKIRDPIGLYDNVVNTVIAYRNSWGEIDAPVHFMTDADCIPLIEKMEPRIVSFFIEEKEGAFKADICRVAALYLHGGYYSDVDMQTVEPFVLSGGKYTFATVRCKEKIEGTPHTSTCGFFQSFIAASPGHLLLQFSMEEMLQVYIKDGDRSMLGVIAMYKAYEKLPEKSKESVYLLNTYALDDTDVGNDMHPDLKRNDGNGHGKGNCNWVVEDEEKKAYFFARSPMPFNSGCMLSSGIRNNLFFTSDTNKEQITTISQFFIDKSFGLGRIRREDITFEEGIYARMFYIFDKARLFMLDNARCVDEVDKANQELGKFYRDTLDTSTDIFFDICVVAVLYNEGGFFHSKDLILNKEGFLPTLDNTRFIATFSPQKQSFTRGYFAASKHHAILKKALNMIIDVTKQSGGALSDTFSVMDIVYQAYMDVGGHAEFVLDICSTSHNDSPFSPILLSEKVPDGVNVIKDSLGQNVNYFRSSSTPGYDKCTQ